MKGKKILVTGASGFIGSKLVERLVILGLRPFTFNGDIRDYNKVKTIFNKVKPDIVYHLASHGVYSYTDSSHDNTDLTIDTNIKGAINLLDAAANSGCRLFVNTGSCFEYGSRKLPFKESDNLSPCNVYGITKAAATMLAKSAVTLRLFTVFGPGENESRFISTTISNCLRGVNPKLTKEKVIRDYIYIDDVVDAYIKVGEMGESLSRGIINISTGIGISTIEVAKRIIELTGSNGLKIEEGAFPTRSGEVLSLIGDNKKAKKLINWSPTHSLTQGLQKTIDSHP
jgi:UDP-glucose 4-epimerase